MSEQIVYKAAVLLGQQNYAAAIRLVLDSRAQLTDVSRVPALLQAFYAAREGGFSREAREIAAAIAIEEPAMPSIQDYL